MKPILRACALLIASIVLAMQVLPAAGPAYAASLPGAFGKIAPENYATNQNYWVQFTWGSSTGATAYYICLKPADLPVCGAADWQSVEDPAHTWSYELLQAALLPGTTYRWAVKATNIAGETYADGGIMWRFTTAPTPGPFSKVSPANGTGDQPPTLTLSWTASSGAQNYDLCLTTTPPSTECGPGNIWKELGGDETSYEIATNALQPSTTYYWQVAAGAGWAHKMTWADGAAGAYWSFTTGSKPDPVSKRGPNNGVANQPKSVTLQWLASNRATEYYYCRRAAGQCDLLTELKGPLDRTWVTIGPLLPSTTYYWDAMACNAWGCTLPTLPFGSKTTNWYFNTGTVPAAFGKVSPANYAASQPRNVTLQWAASTGAVSYAYCLKPLAETCSTTTASDWHSVGVSRSADVSALLSPNATYRWIVRATNTWGDTYSDGSILWRFTTGGIPAAFATTAPANNATNQPRNVTLQWAASPGALSYAYCIKPLGETCSTTTPGDWHSAGASRSADVSASLSPNTAYRWIIRATNTWGDAYSGGSVMSRFTTGGTPAAFTKTAPANYSANQPKNLTLQWSAASDADSYSYCVKTDTISQCAEGDWHSAGTSTSANVSALLAPSTTHRWTVKATNSWGDTYSDSGVMWRFTTTGLPAAFGKTSPVDYAVSQPLKLTLAWQASPGAAGYSYCIVPEADTCTTASWNSVGAATSANITGLLPDTTYRWTARAMNAWGATYSDASVMWRFTTTSATPVTATFESDGVQDGWVLESTETSGIGGTMDAASSLVRVGDDTGNKQWRALLSFDTSGLPDDAIIGSVTLKVRRAGVAGTDPFATLGNLVVDVKPASFGGSAALELADFNAGVGTTGRKAAFTVANTLVNNWYSAAFGTVNLGYVNRSGLTQLRLRFANDDDNDGIADFLKFYSGNTPTAAYRPVLIVQYYKP